ncbi:hypothetical protein KP509_02G079600 [Ceratopteris richardii]|uniref:Magnesium transporter n=1 Tax=Ceratopteris richardii TaxID=49495 RepID=A0A8T2VFV1_CERRI|nr:hypothetical protein KP509_02G079600 [Ceratopteris richardii]
MVRAIVQSVADVQALNKKKAATSRQWMLLDSKGESMVLEVSKYDIMHRVGIHARDLRILDPLLSYPSTVLGRERAIVLNLEHIKAVITAEEVFLRNPTDENVIPIVEELCRRLPVRREPAKTVESNGVDPTKLRTSSKSRLLQDIEDEPPFEFRALEVILEAICSYLDARTTELEADAYPALDELTSKISSRNLDRVRKLKSRMTRLTARVQKVRDELEQLLDDDGDMADLFLTRKLAGSSPPVGSSLPSIWEIGSPNTGSRISRVSRASMATYTADNDVEELEMLLEAYFMQIDGTLNKLTALREYIDDTEDYINIQLIQLELVISAATVIMSMYAAVAGIFGMNIPYPWNSGYNYVFKWVVFLSGVVCLAVFSLILFYARYRGLIGN